MFFLSHFAAKFGKTLDTVPQDTMERLASYAWPGNVRELRNVIERAVVLSEGPILRLSHDLVPMAVAGGQERTDGNHPAALGAPGAGADSAAPVRALTPPRLSTLQDAERDHILAALRESRGVVEGPNGAAQILDLHPNTLRSRMKRLGIKRASHEMS
jgi:formate hydrogenlyase transcriptional activator